MFYPLPGRKTSPLSINVKQVIIHPRALTPFSLSQKARRRLHSPIQRNASIEPQESSNSPSQMKLKQPHIKVYSRCVTPNDRKTTSREAYFLKSVSINSSFMDLSQPTAVSMQRTVRPSRPFSAMGYRHLRSSHIKSKQITPRTIDQQPTTYNSARLKRTILSTRRSLLPYGLAQKSLLMQF